MLDPEHAVEQVARSLARRHTSHAVELVRWIDARDALREIVMPPDPMRAWRSDVVPDAVAVLRTPTGSLALVVAVDTGTMSLKRMRARFAAYARWCEQQGPQRRFDVSGVRILVVGSCVRRLARLRDASIAATRGTDVRFSFATSAPDALR